MYTLNDLVQLATGPLLKEIETIVGIFKKHITVECEICMGNAFICELCTVKEVSYSFKNFHFRCYTLSLMAFQFAAIAAPFSTNLVSTVLVNIVQGIGV